jgi:hypothetical protein
MERSQMFQGCREALKSDDMFTIHFAVESVSHWLLANHPPRDIREEFSRLLEEKARQTSNRVLAAYLRSVAHNCQNLTSVGERSRYH